MQPRLRDYTAETKERQSRLSVGRYIQCLARARGDVSVAAEIARGHREWTDSDMLQRAFLAAVTSMTGADNAALTPDPVSEAFIAAMRSASIPRMLQLRPVPMRTLIYANESGVVGGEIAPGDAAPVLKGDWTSFSLEPRKFVALSVLTAELIQSALPVAQSGIGDDLAAGAAAAESVGFITSILAGVAPIASTGSALAQVDVDVTSLIDSVAGAARPESCFLMTMETATKLAMLRGSGGGAAYPNISPQGGELLGIRVLISAALSSDGTVAKRSIALVDPTAILSAQPSVATFSASTAAGLKMSDPATKAAGTMTSLFQTSSVAIKATIESNWYARSGACGVLAAGY